MTEWLVQVRGYLMLILLFTIALGGILFWTRRAEPRPIVIITPTPSATSTATTSPTPRPSLTPVMLTVAVNGAVVKPGLVRVSEGARVDDVIKAAGGASNEADLSRLNLARRVNDGELIVVPKLGDPTPNPATRTPTPRPTATARPTATPTPVVKVNINTATADELDKLPGIGPAIAQRIIEYRAANGSFKTLEDLMKVRGIGQAEFDTIKNLIVIN